MLRAAGLLSVSVVVLTDGWVYPLPTHPPPPALTIPSEVPAEAVVMELPLGVFEDAAAMYRSIAHRRRTVNGLSGYEAPHYQVLRTAIDERAFGGLEALARGAPIAIFVSRPAVDAEVVSRLTAATGARHVTTTAHHEVLLLPQAKDQPPPAAVLAGLVEVRSLRASANEEGVSRMLDGDRRTAWESGPQRGEEEVVVDLGVAREISQLVLAQGAYIPEYPRHLLVDVSLDGSGWQEVWRGDTLAMTLAAAIDDPAEIRVRLAFPTRPARFVRIRQLGRSEQPWAIAEISVLSTGR